MSLKIKRPDYEQMLAHLQEAYPLEACGLMAGQADTVQHLYPILNIEESPNAFRMDGRQQVKAMLDMEARDWTLLAIYHSHPQGAAAPSADDIAQAHYPDVIQVIVSLAAPERPSVHAFRIANGRVTEIPLLIVQP